LAVSILTPLWTCWSILYRRGGHRLKELIVKAIVVEELGGPEVLLLRDRPARVPEAGQILVRISAAGVNFMDTGARRAGSASSRAVPFVPGVEAAGRVIGLGAGVTDIAVGDRVAWIYAYGSYAEQIALAAADVVPVPPPSRTRLRPPS
jgi:NADPH2:quinone reductase